MSSFSSSSTISLSTQQTNRQRNNGPYKQRQQQQQSQKNISNNSRRRGNGSSKAASCKSDGCLYAFCPGSANGRHSYGPCPKVLFRVVCGFCGLTKKYDRSKNKPTYLRYRRNVRNECQLQTLVAPLVPESRAKVESVLRTCGLQMSPSQRRATVGPAGVMPAAGEPFLTLMDAIVPDEQANASLVTSVQQALASSSVSAGFQMRKMHKIRRKDKLTDLVIADVNISPMLTTALSGAVASKTMLPQFPVHMTLGVAPRARKVSANAVKLARELLRGIDLYADATRVQLIAGVGSSPPMCFPAGKHGSYCTTEAATAMMTPHHGAFIGSNKAMGGYAPPMAFEFDDDYEDDDEDEEEEDEDLSWELANCSLTSLTSASSVESSVTTSTTSSRPSFSPIRSLEDATATQTAHAEDEAAASLPAGLDLSFLAEDDNRGKKTDDTTISTRTETTTEADTDDDDDHQRRASAHEDAPSAMFFGSSPVCVSDVLGTCDAPASTAGSGPCLPFLGEPSNRYSRCMSSDKKSFDLPVLPYRTHNPNHNDNNGGQYYTFSGAYVQG